MGIDASELIGPFSGAIQASFSVLLTIAFGVLAAQCNLLSTSAAKEVSKLCVRMLLPALLIFKIGSNLHKDTAVWYVPFLIWSIAYTLLSILLGRTLTRIFKLPSWVTLAIAFNNTTSLPLLLIESLKQTQVLDAILVGGDTAANALDRAESCFLINAMVSNSLTFALGPRLLKPGDEDALNKAEEGTGDEGDSQEEEYESGDIERGPDGLISERASLLPQRIIRPTNRIEKKGYLKTQAVEITWQFANAPLLGAIVGAIIGLTPSLHKLFFSKSNEGGYFNAWLTVFIKNIGDLFASTQIIVVGVKLSQSMLHMKRGESGGHVSKSSLATVTFSRFFIWPLISIPIIWILASKTQLLGADPMLWFAMMLMPTGPLAMILVALTDVTGAPEAMKMTIAKLLTISYAITPLICFAVVGSLKATEAAICH
ncbi:auxin efflux carrier [Phaeosphaeriaceae sp. PMI808]|nr:auxin efflux carrier [Phaeosphaeriaceae sp. PMI808]